MLVESDWVVKEPFDKIIWCSGSHQPELFNWLKERVPKIKILNYFPAEEIENGTLFDSEKLSLLICDDLMVKELNKIIRTNSRMYIIF